ncbi:MAG: hypothetical protein A2W99_07080 [Bacteroidetes bacterium GWF2_33_16]|nr:MAG: hypothetical protein A2X00_11860 [Bacteroidetes bacterium GWE2_32_14]OFY03156.1 MAG: hypothetical protein A2W99_07080 [Bacteroidetes bacterium GWF2_33_16]
MNTTSTSFIYTTIKSVLFDIIALAFIYFVPAISHLLSLPVYLIEPMRLMLILALVHTTKQNAYIIALSLPLFSFLISAHPVLPKMVLISFELVLNVFLFFALLKKLNNTFLAVLISIITSKLIYYLLKFALLKFAIIDSNLISTPIVFQVIMILIFSSYLFSFYKK